VQLSAQRAHAPLEAGDRSDRMARPSRRGGWTGGLDAWRLGDESLRDAADRFLEALRKVNPQLARASYPRVPGDRACRPARRPT
jgi:hypothetical protein